MNVNRLLIASSAAFLMCSISTNSTLLAQWSHDPAANLGISLRGSDQNQAKILPTADGGCWMVWLDGIGTGWDTRVQRLNARGIPQLGANGVLVADTSFSSTEDYGFAVDADGNAVIAYRDNSSGTTHIEVQKIDPAGNLLWNAAGVQVSDAASNSPRVCATSDGSVIAAWSQSGSIRVQRLDADGAPQWAAGGVSDVPPAGLYFLSELVADNTGGAIALYHHQTGGFSSPRHVKAQKFDSTGAKAWNSGSPVAIFDGGSIQLGNFPTMISDGAGGLITSWYETGGVRNVYVQRVDAAGAEVFAHNGIAAADTIPGRIRISAIVARDAATGDMYTASLESNASPQGSYSVRVQRLDSAGVKQWSATGIELTSQGADQPSSIQVQTIPNGGGAFFCWSNGGLNTQQVFTSRLDAAGAFIWSPSILAISNTPAGKSRIASTMNSTGSRLLLAWADNKNGGTNDIYAQSVNLDGSLGNPGDVNDDGVVNVADLLAVITAWGACPAPPTFCAPDLSPAPIGDAQVDVGDLLAVIVNWD